MARRLLNQQGYSTNNLKVLLGGWGLWKDKHAQDPKTYPTVPDTLPTPLPVQQNVQPVLPPTATVSR
ncbi:MAG TPA: hypothetical protein VJ183_07870 [Chloroflexia bacterium]|nr:hypothetical protein [Chloroflexia bacterium]